MRQARLGVQGGTSISATSFMDGTTMAQAERNRTAPERAASGSGRRAGSIRRMARERSGKLAPGARNPRLHRSYRNIADGGRLLVAELLGAHQHQRFAQQGR